MWIVHLALRRPYTFVVFSILILILGALASIVSPKDIFPYINIPVVSIVWTYTGLTPDEMEKRIVTVSERAMTTTVNDIEHMESESYTGTSVIRVYFQPNVKVELAVAQVTAIVQTILRVLPPGTFPPNVLKYDASSVPILQLGLSGEGLTEQDLYDLGLNFIRTRLATVQGASLPLPWGGKTRQIMVDLDQDALYAKHLSPADISTALNAQNIILPAGTARIGNIEYLVKTNSSPLVVSALNDLPIHASNGAVVYMKDVAQVRNGYAVQTNLVRENGRRSSFLSVLKNGRASTLDIVNSIKKALPRVKADLPSALRITPLFDQSVFVRSSINEVLREAGIAAFLTALMILLFLGSWRSTLIVCVSIPLSILTSICILAALGQTINVMTLGGLALAVGILVDDATVELENTHRNLDPVDFIGWQEDLRAVYADLDLLVVPSSCLESTTRVILEAYSAGVPVVAFPSGGIPEIVKDNETGFLTVEPTAGALVSRIHALLEMENTELMKIIHRAREVWAQRYTLEIYREGVCDVLEHAASLSEP